jgi:hypothetical protein
VAEIAFLPETSAEDLLALLGVIKREPDDVREFGGIAAMLDAAGVSSVQVVTVALAVTTELERPDDGDVDDFFRELAFDRDKLATWLAAATRADTFTLSAGIGELANAAGEDGMARFLSTFAAAFLAQDMTGRDALLALGVDDTPSKTIVGGMLANVPAANVAGTLTAGLYGRNMLSLSTALSRLPFGERLDEVIAQVRASMAEAGRDAREDAFLEHMLQVRSGLAADAPVTETDQTFQAVLGSARVAPEMLEHTKAEAAKAVGHIDVRAVTTMLALLDQQQDFALYVRSLDALAGMVPRLIAQGDLGLAVTVLHEIADRESRTTQPWPELTQRLRAALANATARPAMAALLDAFTADPGLESDARAVMLLADDVAVAAFVSEALSRHTPQALAAAERLLGARMADVLAASAPRVPSAEAGVLARLLVERGDARSLAALDALAARRDEAARLETADALAESHAPAAVPALSRLLRDPSEKVAAAAARALATGGKPGAGEALAERLAELDVGTKDFAQARELIGRLSQLDDPASADALRRIAERKALLKRGRFAEVQQLAREALAAQAGRVAR